MVHYCAGFEGGAFNEVQIICPDHAVQWAGAFGNAYQTITEMIETPHQNELRDKLNLKRVIKWKFLLLALLLRKPPLNKGTKTADLKLIVQQRLNQYMILGTGTESSPITKRT